MSDHTHACSGCGKGCSDSQAPPQQNEGAEIPLRQIKRVIGLMSGKGGVGKSLITALLATALAKSGKQTAILDADILCPSIPSLFRLQNRAISGNAGLYPAITAGGIKVMSLGLLMERETDPVIWPGPIQAKAAAQFWSDVIWDEVDYMLIDLPSGTGDVPQRVMKEFPLNGIFIISSPQALAQTAAVRVKHMAQNLSIPVLGLIENFSEDSSLATEDILDRLPPDPRLSIAADQGQIESLDHPYLVNSLSLLQQMAQQ